MNLNIKEAYNISTDFLEKYYEKNPSDDLGILLSCMMFLEDENPIDPALWEDWIDAANNIKTQYKKTKSNKFINFSLKEAYKIMEIYLKAYGERINSINIKILLKKIILPNEPKYKNSIYWQEWINSADKIKKLGDKAGIMFYDQFTQNKA